MTADIIFQQLQELGNPAKAAHSLTFFKTTPGGYGEGDRFLGITVPEVRVVAKGHPKLSLSEIEILLANPYHECRMCALLILVEQFKKADEEARRILFDFYRARTFYINNWDLVDLSCYAIVGEWLADKDRQPLYTWSRSPSLWEQRIAIVSTMAFIRRNDFADTLQLSESYLSHPHDLIHKACGWMLREIGKRDEKALTGFLDIHYTNMPRTMLRYAIERLSPQQRAYYLKK